MVTLKLGHGGKRYNSVLVKQCSDTNYLYKKIWVQPVLIVESDIWIVHHSSERMETILHLFNDEPTLETIGITVHIECAQTFIYFDLKQLQHMRVITTLGAVYMSLASLVIRLSK